MLIQSSFEVAEDGTILIGDKVFYHGIVLPTDMTDRRITLLAIRQAVYAGYCRGRVDGIKDAQDEIKNALGI